MGRHVDRRHDVSGQHPAQGLGQRQALIAFDRPQCSRDGGAGSGHREFVASGKGGRAKFGHGQ